jgi:hypothetical protein
VRERGRWLYVGLGENGRVFQWLNRAYDERSGWLPYLDVEPRLGALRSDPRFKDRSGPYPWLTLLLS